MADNAIDVLDAAAPDALDMMMVVFYARLVTRAGAVRQADTPDQPLARQVVDDHMDGLQRNGGKGRAHPLENRFCIRMRMVMQEIKHGNPLGRGAQTPAPQGCGPVMGARMVGGR